MPSQIKLIVILIGLMASFFFGVRYQAGVVAQERLSEQNALLAKSNTLIKNQGGIAKQAQEKANALQNRYVGAVSHWRDSVRQPSAGEANNDTSAALQDRSFLLSGADGEVLIGFARACQQSENERNTLIGLYNLASDQKDD